MKDNPTQGPSVCFVLFSVFGLVKTYELGLCFALTFNNDTIIINNCIERS